MPILFTCPHCGTKSQVADQYAGQSGPCAACGKPVTIPYAGGGGPSHGPAAGMSIVAILAVVGVVGVCVVGGLLLLLLPAVQAARGAARRMESGNNLKQIGLAIHNHVDATGILPAAYNTDKDGKPLLSWRVQILPYIGERALYDRFHFDEPWDSEHNKMLIPLMPKVYAAAGSRAEPGKTNYLAIRARTSAISTPLVSDNGKKWPSGKYGLEMPDGTSNTVMVVEASDEQAVIWTKPDDYTPDVTMPIKGLVGLRPRGFLALFADGSVKFLNDQIDAKTFMNLFTCDDGQVVRLPTR